MNKKFIILFGIFFISITALCQQDRTQRRINVGDDYFENHQYHEAIDVYERILRREDSQDIRREVSFKLAEAFRMILNYSEAKNWYKTAMNLGYDDPVIYLNLSEMSLGLEEFDEAISYAEQFLEYKPENERGLKFLESAKYSKEHYDRETLFEVSFEEALSSESEEWGVTYMENYTIFYDDPVEFDRQFDIEINLFHNNIIYWATRYETPKEKIVFSSTRKIDDESLVETEQGSSNIFQVLYSQQDEDWDPVEPARGGINSDYYDGFLTYDENEGKGYFMNCGGFEGERETCDIYVSDYDDGADVWGEAELFEYNSDDYNIGYPSINNEGNVIYFASDNPEGHGGYDLYKTHRDEEGYWDEPENLGSTINTQFNDAYPFIAGDVLYFSSFGHAGMGGFDIFFSIIDEEGNYGEPQNMGAPINSSADDFGFVINDDYTEGYFSSNRPGGSGSDDIYSFNVLSESITIKGLVTDRVTQEPLENLEFYIIGDDDSFYTVSTDQNGQYELPDLSTDVNYEIEVLHEDYSDYNENILVRDQLVSNQFEVVSEYNYNIELTPETPIFAEDEEEKEDPEIAEIDEIVTDDEITVYEEEAIDEDIPEYTEMVEEPEPEPEAEPEPGETQVIPEIDLTDYDLPTIHFDFAEYDLKPFSKKQLDTVVKFLNANPDKGLVIHAHTDEIARHLINFYLSQKRAFSAMNYLIKNGIEEERLYPFGHGKMKLAIENAETDYEHRLNRRADFEPQEISEFQAYVDDAPQHSFRYLNSIEEEVHFTEGIEFMVQFTATRNPVHPQFYQKITEQLPRLDIIYYYGEDRFHRYLAGSFRNFNSAYNVLGKLRELGYDTYIVAFNNGKRISVSLAQSLINDQE